MELRDGEEIVAFLSQRCSVAIFEQYLHRWKELFEYYDTLYATRLTVTMRLREEARNGVLGYVLYILFSAPSSHARMEVEVSQFSFYFVVDVEGSIEYVVEECQPQRPRYLH